MYRRLRIRAFYPNFFGDQLIAYVSLRIMLYFNSPEVQADIMGYSSERSLRKYKAYKPHNPASSTLKPIQIRVYRDAIPPGFPWALVRRIFKQKHFHALAEWRFFTSLHKDDIIYLWPEASLKLHRRLKAAGFMIVSERINTLLLNSKRILDAEYEALGLPRNHTINQAAAEEERSCMRLSDFIFSPSPGVTQSLLDAGILPSKILQSSYGLEAHEIFLPLEPNVATGPVTAIFVGSICVRKGIHLLLRAWAKAAVTARLIVVGQVFPEVEVLFREALQRHPDIKHVGFVSDLGPIYRDADFLILPSIEEGSPLVTYLALGAGIPSLVSPMGAGGIIDDGVEGIIIDPHDTDQLAQAIRTMVLDDKLRTRMGEAARAKAPRFVWEKVAVQRRDLLLSKLGLMDSST